MARWVLKIERANVAGLRLLEEISPKTERDGREVIASVTIDPENPTELRVAWVEGVTNADKQWARRQVRKCVEDHDPDAKSADEVLDQADDDALVELEGSTIPEVAKLAKLLRRERGRRRSLRPQLSMPDRETSRVRRRARPPAG